VIVTVAKAASTNADLSARLHAGERLPEGDWLVADRQTAGRGRQGRAWFDGAGNFMGSTVVWPGAGDPPAPSLALVAGLAVHAAACSFLPAAMADRPLLKWPNDLMIGQAKLAGILLERVGDAVIAGIGVNLVAAPMVEGRATAALADFAPPPPRDTFAGALAAAFAGQLADWRRHGLAATVARWTAVAHPVGTPLHVGERGAVPLIGQFGGLDASGALILNGADGTRHTVHAGEVRLAPPPQGAC
jgi:BirA family biotin operon repressor/biotin-[acetyl-CoA-carboxylase] ligase